MALRPLEFTSNADDGTILTTTSTLASAWIDVSGYKSFSIFVSGLKVSDATDKVTLEFANGAVGPTNGSANGTSAIVGDANGVGVASFSNQPWHWLRVTKTAAAVTPGAATVQLFGQR